jgi:transcriptional regulator with XRE-family HTH domain
MESERLPALDAEDPERTAGQEIQAMRKARKWSQGELGEEMKSYGYDFNQALISRIELGQRPLRVRELVDFAKLFNVQPAALLRPYPNMSLEEVEASIAELEAEARETWALADRLMEARGEAIRREGQLTLLRQRRDYLQQGRDYLQPGEDES